MTKHHPFELTTEDDTGFAEAIGQFFINYGALEYLTYSLVEVLGQKTPALGSIAAGMTMAQRLHAIEQLLLAASDNHNQNGPLPLQQEILQITKIIHDIGEFREGLVKNPIVLGRTQQSPTTVAFLGFPSSSQQQKNAQLTVEKVTMAVKATQDLAATMRNIILQLNADEPGSELSK